MTRVSVNSQRPSVQTNPNTVTGVHSGPATPNSGGTTVASQPEVDAETDNTKAVSALTLAKKALKAGSYSTTLTFATDQDIYKDATGLSPSFALGASGNVNGKVIILRLDSPTAVTFDSNFIPSIDSSPFSSTELNICTLVYYADYDGQGTQRVVYQNINSMQSALVTGTYGLILNFDIDEDIYQDVTGQNPVFLLGSNNVNGVVKFLRMNKPASVTFPANFVADSSSVAFDPTSLNVCMLIYFSDWGAGSSKVIYSNKTFTAL